MKDTLIGRKVQFDLKDVSTAEFCQASADRIRAHNGTIAKVTGLACEVDDAPWNSYYDLEFFDGFKLDAVSGYHLTVLPDMVTITLTPNEAEELRDAADKPWQRSAQYMLRKLADKLP